MENNSLLDKVTIIIPSYYLHHYLKRTLEYYKNSSVKIMVVDSTDVVFKDKDDYNIEYYHLPNTTYSKKLYFAAQKVTTDYIIMCSHDDFVLLNSIVENVNFLEDNKDYSTSQGATLFYNTRYNSFNIISYNKFSHNVCVDSNTPEERLSEQFNPFTHQVYSLVRKGIFEDVFRYCSKYNIRDIAISELIQAGIYSISGKFNNFDSMYYIQENLENSCASQYYTYLLHDKNKEDHQNTRLILKNYLQNNSNLSLIESEQYINRILDNFLKNFEDSFFIQVKKFIRKQIPNKLLKFKDLNYFRKNKKKIYKNLSQNDQQQFNNIEKFVNNYIKDLNINVTK